jgi:hypothetical protein
MNQSNYFKHYNKLELLYYSSQGILKDDIEFLKSKFITDYQKGELKQEQVKEIIESLTPKQQADLYKEASSLIDPFAPDEDLLDLLDIIDPFYSHSNTGGDS